MEDDNPVQLSRNRACFSIPGKNPGFVTITDSFSTFFHVSLTFPSDVSAAKQLQICERVCPKIRETILTGIRKASRKLNYSNSIPEIAFVCSSHQPSSLHPATLADADLLTCTTHPGSVCCEMTEGHKLWLGKAPPASTDTSGMQFKFHNVAMLYMQLSSYMYCMNNLSVYMCMKQINKLIFCNM